MKKRIITSILFCILASALITGCSGRDSKNSSVGSSGVSSAGSSEIKKETKSESSEDSQVSRNSAVTEYDKMTTFEYTKDMLSDMNKDDPDFEITHDKSETTISGHINRSPVKSEKDVLEQLKLVRSVLGLVNPDQQLVSDSNSGKDGNYRFNQYHGGYAIDSCRITVETDDKGFIVYTSSSVLPADTLKKIKLEGLLSEEKVLEKNKDYKNAEIQKTVIWSHNKYSDKPVVAYIGHSGDNTIVFSAVDGSIADIWSDIID